MSDDCQDPDLWVAVTVALVSGPGATACQISAVPSCALARCRRVQVRPPPATEANCAALEPSDDANASTSSFVPVVVSPVAATVVAAVPWCFVTSASTEMVRNPLMAATVAPLDAALTLPAASCAVTV